MTIKSLQNRLHRIQGQLNKLEENIVTEKDCSDVIPQFLAAKGALSSAFDEYVKYSLNTCIKTDEEKMRKIISQLVKS